MGRCKIAIKYLGSKTNRVSTYRKRSVGLLKKADELHVLCGAKVRLIITPRKEDGGHKRQYLSTARDTYIHDYPQNLKEPKPSPKQSPKGSPASSTASKPIKAIAEEQELAPASKRRRVDSKSKVFKPVNKVKAAPGQLVIHPQSEQPGLMASVAGVLVTEDQVNFQGLGNPAWPNLQLHQYPQYSYPQEESMFEEPRPAVPLHHQMSALGSFRSEVGFENPEVGSDAPHDQLQVPGGAFYYEFGEDMFDHYFNCPEYYMKQEPGDPTLGCIINSDQVPEIY